MVPEAEKQQASIEHLNELSGPIFKIKRDPRITPFGFFIRETSIDELPQLFNVLLGQMSLVGPRPLPARDISRFPDLSAMRRFSVKPGITGLWQVSGRNNLGFDDWIRLDLRYIDDWSLALDLRILLQTFSEVISRRGAA
jgi:lipopolysaccharide/colanic/teichoic acid biosynthesis glycosyltransferase